MKSQEVSEKIISICGFISSLVVNNIFFIFTNLPVFVYLFLVFKGITSFYILPLYFLMITIPFSLIALFNTFYMYVGEDKYIGLKNYFVFFKRSFNKDSLSCVLLIYLMFTFILLLFSPTVGYITTLFSGLWCFLAVLSFLMIPYALMEDIVFQNTVIQTLMNALFLMINNKFLTIGIVTYSVFCLLIVREAPAVLMFAVFSGYSFLFISFYQKKLLKRIESVKKREINEKAY